MKRFQILSRDTPIFNPEIEKGVADKGRWQYLHFLRELFCRGSVLIPRGVLEERLSKVYELCFKKSGNKDVSVVADFAAHYPNIVFQAEWLTGILRSPLLRTFRDPQTGVNRLLKALSTGFGRAAKPVNPVKRLRRDAGRASFPMIKAELESLVTEADLLGLKKEGTREAKKRAKNFVELKLQELAKRYGDLGPGRGKVTDLLIQAKAYEAAVAMTSRLYGVRERSLEGMPEAQRAAESIWTIRESEPAQPKT